LETWLRHCHGRRTGVQDGEDTFGSCFPLLVREKDLDNPHRPSSGALFMSAAPPATQTP
jgi:hypothetical protein